MLFILIMLGMIVWTIPGAVLARGLYSEAVREIRSKPVQVVPPKPVPPKFKTIELLHDNGPMRACQLVNPNRSSKTCTCSTREEWAENRAAWSRYHEWVREYGHIKNGVVDEPTIDTKPIALAVPFWPLMLLVLYIKGGANNIPDYREIERMEKNLLDYNEPKELQ